MLVVKLTVFLKFDVKSKKWPSMRICASLSCQEMTLKLQLTRALPSLQRSASRNLIACFLQASSLFWKSFLAHLPSCFPFSHLSSLLACFTCALFPACLYLCIVFVSLYCSLLTLLHVCFLCKTRLQFMLTFLPVHCLLGCLLVSHFCV